MRDEKWNEIEEALTYDGDDLGASYTKEETVFKVWAPLAEAVQVLLYQEGHGDCLMKTLPMEKQECGIWSIAVAGDWKGKYYTYRIVHNQVSKETQDVYSYAVGVNGNRSMIVNLSETNPEGFDEDKGPALVAYTDAIITEISVRDHTSDVESNIEHRGKYLGLTEEGTKTSAGFPSGIDYITSLGVTHVQLMPAFDFASIDEADKEAKEYNWGYDPKNYNVPEGSYATDPYHGEVRIKEFKQMVMAFHKKGIGVIMDVVYNHTYDVENSCFQKTVPDYYYRKDGEAYSNASACGNEIASERKMVRKFIIDSVCFWAKEYHVDGFRFDLMGVLDIETMNELQKRLEKINPFIILYGEGWAGGNSVYEEEKRAIKLQSERMPSIAMFSDDMRDTVKGHVFYEKEKGFVNGQPNMANALKYSIVGATWHPQVAYEEYQYTPTGAWAKHPTNTVNYVSCHDNLTLWDKLCITCPDAEKKVLKKMNRLAAAIVMTSQGIPFFLGGEEMLRTKPVGNDGEISENSYNLPIETNMIRYQQLVENKDVFEYYKGLIAFRKKHHALRMTSNEAILKNLKFIPTNDKNLVIYSIKEGNHVVFVAYNANPYSTRITLPTKDNYKIYINGATAGTSPFATVRHMVEVDGISALVAVSE